MRSYVAFLRRMRRCAKSPTPILCHSSTRQGMCRLVAQRLVPLVPNLGLRKSHLGMLLMRHIDDPPTKKRLASQFFQRAIPRMTPLQLLMGAAIVARLRLSSSVLASILSQLQKPKCSPAFRDSPKNVANLAQALVEPASQFRDAGLPLFVQYMASKLAENVHVYGTQALNVFVAIAQAGGPFGFRRFSGDDLSSLVLAVCSRWDLHLHENGTLVGHLNTASTSSLFCALSRIGFRNVPLITALSRRLADEINELDVAHLPLLARALYRGDSPFDDFVLLHGIARRSSAAIGLLDAASVISLFQVFGRYDLYDEEFMELGMDYLRACAPELSPGSLANAIAALGSLNAGDMLQLEPLCDALRPKVRDLNEGDLVRCMRGLVRLRHTDELLLQALEPVIEKNKLFFSPLSLSNVFSVISLYGTSNQLFLKNLLIAVKSQIHRFSSASVQHILTALCRQLGRIPIMFPGEGSEHEDDIEFVLAATLSMACAHLALPMVARQVTPVQAVSSLSALAKLKHRDLVAASVLLSVLAGRGGSVIWSWAPSANFYAHLAVPGSPFDVNYCRERLQKHLDSSQYVEILQSIHRLELHSALTMHLVMVLCTLVVPHLHELRAREVIAVARAIGACQLPAHLMLEQCSVLESSAPTARETTQTVVAQSESVGAASAATAADPWKEHLAERCLENLRRHEHYLEGSWHTLLPFKLLCLEIDTGTFGSRSLPEVVSPRLLSFAERLRSFSRADCELLHLRAASALAEEDGVPGTTGLAAKTMEPVAMASCGPGESEPAPEVLELARHRVVTGSRICELPVDVLVEATA